MRSGTTRFLCLVWVLSALGATAARSGDAPDGVRAAASKLRDISITAVVVKADEDELRKMGKKYAQGYEFKKVTATFKLPNKFRMEGKLGMVRVTHVMSGETSVFRIPAVRFSRREDLKNDANRKRSCLDFGLVTPGLWDIYKVKLLQTENTASGDVLVYELVSPDETVRPHKQRIYVDAKDFRLLKREKFTGAGKMRARYVFKDFRQVGGVVLMPFRVELYSAAGNLAGATEFRNVKVNQGVPDTQFQ